MYDEGRETDQNILEDAKHTFHDPNEHLEGSPPPIKDHLPPPVRTYSQNV